MQYEIYLDGEIPSLAPRNIGFENTIYKKKLVGETKWRTGEEISEMLDRGENIEVEKTLKESRYSRMRRLGVLIGGGNAERRAEAEQQQIVANHLISRIGEVSGGAIATPDSAEENIIKIELFFLEVLPTSSFSKMLIRWNEHCSIFAPRINLKTNHSLKVICWLRLKHLTQSQMSNSI